MQKRESALARPSYRQFLADHHPVFIEPRNGHANQYQQMLTPQELAFGLYEPGRYALILEMIEVFEKPIPASGKQMFGWKWTRPDDSAIVVPEAEEGFVLK
jgi:hypothetical protein